MAVKKKIGTFLKRGAKRPVGRPFWGTRHPFLNMGRVHEAGDDWRVVFADESLQFCITQEIVNKSIGRSGRFCVVALALEKFFGKRYDFQVGAAITKIWDFKEKIELRYKTPQNISRAIRTFDTTGEWGLPANIYKLAAYPQAMIEVTKKSAKKSRLARAEKRKVDLLIRKNPTAAIRRKPTKHRAPATRTVLRHARISWNPPTI
jgi:hypothetical protein